MTEAKRAAGSARAGAVFDDISRMPVALLLLRLGAMVDRGDVAEDYALELTTTTLAAIANEHESGPAWRAAKETLVKSMARLRERGLDAATLLPRGKGGSYGG